MAHNGSGVQYELRSPAGNVLYLPLPQEITHLLGLLADLMGLSPSATVAALVVDRLSLCEKCNPTSVTPSVDDSDLLAEGIVLD